MPRPGACWGACGWWGPNRGRSPPGTWRRSSAGARTLGSSESHVQALQELPARHAMVRSPGAAAVRLRTQPVPDPVVAEQELAAVEAHYQATSFRSQQEIVRALDQYRTPTPGRTSRLQSL